MAERPARVRACYLDRDGRAQEIEADGILATCHGVLFIDHLSRLKRDLLMRKFRKAAKHAAPAHKDGAGKERAPASTGA